MTNLDKVRAMSAEELVLKYHSASECEVCAYFEDDECSLKGHEGQRECNGGRIKWLNQDTNPIPDLEVGDIIYSYYPEIAKMVCYVYLDNNVMWCCTDNVFVDFANDMKKFIKSIYRKSQYSYDKEKIWRAE